jgi:hypothetical protein
MRLTELELVVVGLLIVYIAFFSHPPPPLVKMLFSTPVGHAVFLALVVWVTVYKSQLIGVFLGITYVMMAASTTEYLDPAEQKDPKKIMPQPKSAGVPAPSTSVKDIMGKLKKGDTVAHMATAGKSVTTPPPAMAAPKPAASKALGTFGSAK